jgi:lipoprotein NlpD
MRAAVNAIWRAAVFVVAAALMIACVDEGRVVPVTDRSLYPRQATGDRYIVQRGDTLFSIARRFGEDYRALADRNGIKPPFGIRVGQQLALGGRVPTSGSSLSSPEPSTVVGADVAPGAEVFAVPGTLPAETPEPFPLDGPDSKSAVAERPGGVNQTTEIPAPAKTPEPVHVAAPRKGKWHWPAKGKVARKFPAADGLDIVGERGQAIVATAPGRVVYGGSGLRGYGKLIIIKHNDEFLSAYAHNDRLFVQEGQRVQQGQKIAEMGMSGTDRVKLHFQIRRNGAPVDPLKFLPAL